MANFVVTGGPYTQSPTGSIEPAGRSGIQEITQAEYEATYGVVPTSPRDGEATFGGRYAHSRFIVSGTLAVANPSDWTPGEFVSQSLGR